jgi:guanosine-3',5'-bis(diphosphate) 3'-pyrophosphohydrolase
VEAFFDKAKEITSVEEATALLWKVVPIPDASSKEALDLAMRAHEGQVRKSGEPYIVHPILVAAITAYISNDQHMVQAALLHDVVEDTDYTIEELEERFGEDVAHMVEGLTKIIEIRDEELLSSASEDRMMKSALTFRKMLVASIKDVRVLVIKLCDRLHNMLTLDSLSVEKQRRISEETLVVYAPIAHRLGISKMKNYLEDLSFYYIYRKDYELIDHYIKENAQNLQIKLNLFISKVEKLMLQNGFDEDEFEIFGRVKHHYSIYRKMQRKGVGIEEVLDLLAVRILVREPLDCYRVLGLMHVQFTPLVSRFKDYIAVPKENGYKTIHTTIFSQEGILEAQLRTYEMHDLAEYGVAAHWKYKAGSSDAVNLDWIEGLHYHHTSVKDFYELAKCDLYSEDITVLSPDGDLYNLPKGSTALDFAYAIHSEVGDCAVDAIINKRNASLLTTLKNSDMVKIIKDDEVHFHCSWVDTVKTAKAREGIRSLCRTRLKKSNKETAYNILQTLFEEPKEVMERVVTELNLQESIHLIVSKERYFKEVIDKIITKLGTKKVAIWRLFKRGYKRPQKRKIDHFYFFGNRSIDEVVFDYCCHPKVGDDIVAFYDNGKAVIHHKLCKFAHGKIEKGEAMLHVSWVKSRHAHYRLMISLQNRQGILADLLVYLAKLNLNVLKIELGIQRSEEAEFCKIDVESHEDRRGFFEEKIKKRFNLIEMVSLDDAYNK